MMISSLKLRCSSTSLLSAGITQPRCGSNKSPLWQVTVAFRMRVTCRKGKAPMTTQIDHAILLYKEASRADQQGNIERAEMLYMESRRIFEHAGGIHRLDAARIMNAIAGMKQHIGDFTGALAAAQDGLKVLGHIRYSETGGKDTEIRLQA